jgi:hypothetical protein
MDQIAFAMLHARVEAELMKIPGVVGVGFGVKERDGDVTDIVAFRVYVKAKRPPGELDRADLIPEEIGGYPTDVLEMQSSVLLHCQDISTHSPLISGISLTNFKNGANASAGTLGFFATVDGLAGPKNVVLVSNNHVLCDGAVKDDVIYQPSFLPQPNGTIPLNGTPGQQNPIGKIYDVGKLGDIDFAYSGEPTAKYFVDCASALLDIKLSSWCKTNCGISYKNEVRILNINGNSKIASVARVKQSDVDAPGDITVYKVGRTTSRTKGIILDALKPAGELRGHNGQVLGTFAGRVIEIKVTEPNCNGIMEFADSGDSGSALIDEQNRLIGIVFSGNVNDHSKANACHIHPVLAQLKITAITSANPPIGPAGEARADASGSFAYGINEAIPLRDRLRASPRGAHYYAEALRHCDEVLGLVNECRPVTVAWHRGKGPDFLAHAANNLRNPDHMIPSAIEGVSREMLLRRLAEELRANGGYSLNATIDRYFDEALGLINRFDDLRDLACEFEREEAETRDGTS